MITRISQFKWFNELMTHPIQNIPGWFFSSTATYLHSFWSPDMWRMRSVTAQQTDSHTGCIHSRGALLFGHCGPRQQGQPLLSTKPSPGLPAQLSLPDEGGSEGEDEQKKLQFRNQCTGCVTKLFPFLTLQHKRDKYTHHELPLMLNNASILLSQGHNSSIIKFGNRY